MSLFKFEIPHVMTLLTGIVLVAALFTFVVPSGFYERETKMIGGAERTLVVPETYQRIPKQYDPLPLLIGGDADEGKARPVGVHGFLTAIPRGLEQSADIIFFIFIIGGVFGVLNRTGVLQAAIASLLHRFEGSPTLMTMVLVTVLAAGGSTLGMAEEFIPLVPIFLVVAAKLGFDRIFGVALVLLSAEMGFAAATTNPFTVNIAQGIAEVPLNSGIGLRLAFFVVCVGTVIAYLLRYGRRLHADPSSSLLGADSGIDEAATDSAEVLEPGAMQTRQLVTLALCGLVFVGILFGVQRFGWWMSDMAGGFLLMGFVAAIAARLSVADASNAFVRGMEDMVVAALVVGFARGIQVVMVDGQILDTLVHGAASVLGMVPRYVAVVGMLFFQTLLNFFIPSGSGQAAVTMPLMAPLADVLGITRQTAVLAFQFGDGLSNILVPTSGIVMAMLTLGRIPYGTWLRFVLPLFFLMTGIAAVFLIIAVAIGYS